MSLFNWLKRTRAKSMFSRNSVYGDRNVFTASAACQNLTGNKENIQIGSNSKIMGCIHVSCNGKIRIGNNFYLGGGSLIGAAESIRIGENVIISNDVKIFDNNNHPVSPKMRERMSKEGFSNDNWSWKWADKAEVVIEDNVWIGQFSTVLKGVTIGKGSIVGTKAVVTKDVPPYTIVAGNPARVVKRIEEDEI